MKCDWVQDNITLYVYNELADDARYELEQHVARCATCMGPSPMLYYATHELGVGGGIQVTGSHNPGNYNGFKMLLNGRSVFGEEIQKLGRIAAAGEWVEGHGLATDQDVLDAYVDRLVRDFGGGSYLIGWDAGNGAAGPAVLGPGFLVRPGGNRPFLAPAGDQQAAFRNAL